MRAEAQFALGWELLPQVSRSFALVIRWLPRNVGDAVMTSYLLCRIADTIEDSTLAVDLKRRLLEELPKTLDSGSLELPSGAFAPPYDRLMTQTDAVLACYRSFDPRVRSAIAARLSTMCQGMSSWADRRIRTLADQSDYCYYVAGIVGQLLTDLFALYGHVDARTKASLERHAVDFGLALQKVNIIRDVRADLLEGRCYWPEQLMQRRGVSREGILLGSNLPRALDVMQDLILDTWPYLASAVRYVTLVPASQLRIRVFCSIPLFMAVATLGKCHCNAQVFLGNGSVKITSAQLRTIVVRTLAFGRFNVFLRNWFRNWHRAIVSTPTPWPGALSLLH